MFEVEDGNIESALEIFDEWLLPASAQSPLEACDAAGLLWRLALEGVVAEERRDSGRSSTCMRRSRI